MNDYVIVTDSACDISPARLTEWGVVHRCLSFHFEGEDAEYSNEDMPVKVFYDRMRTGGVAKTSAVSPDSFRSAFTEILNTGKDVLYLGFSSALSATYQSGTIAAEELRGKYPARKIITVDTLCASVGEGLIVYLAAEKKRTGASIEETAAYVEEIKWKICHWFSVDDLVYLKRGGRISPATALVGTVLGVKPLLKVDDAGALCSVSKVRGRRAALWALVNQYGKDAAEPGDGTVFIGHGDCAEDALAVQEHLKERYHVSDFIISDVGPVIGAHTGPGIVVVCFVGKGR